MLTIKVHAEEGKPLYVLKKDLHEAIANEYSDNEVKINEITKAYSEMITGSTVLVLQREPLIAGIYPWDLLAIFHRLNIPVKLIGNNEKQLKISKGMSGISDWI
jgi:hypothetical protein